jgi:hypothetical protein
MALSPFQWTKPRKSNSQGACVEVKPELLGGLLVRDSKCGEHSPLLSFDANSWQAFVNKIDQI